MVGGEVWGDVSARIDSMDVIKTVIPSETKGVEVSLEIVSNRDQPATVTVTDPLPDDAVREVEFVEDSTDWITLDGAVQFERTLQADEEVSTEYRFRYDGEQRYSESSELPAVDVEPTVETGTEEPLVRSGSASAARGRTPPTAEPEPNAFDDRLSRPPTDEELESVAATAGDQFDEMPRVYHLRVTFAADATPEDRVTMYDGVHGWFHVLANAPNRRGLSAREGEPAFDVVFATTDDLSGLESTFEELTYLDSVTMSRIDDRSSAASGDDADSGSESTASRTDALREEFDDVRRDVDVLEAEELLDDDDYLEFVDEFGEFSDPNDELSLDEVLAYAGERTADAEPTATDDGAADVDLGAKWDAESDAPVTEALLSELEQGLPDEQAARLRKAFPESSRSLEVRVSHLQSEFQDLAAYIEALEAFIDERGTADEILEDVRSDLTGVREDVSRLRDRDGDRAAELEAVREDLDRLSARLDDHEDAVAEDLRSVEESITALDEELAAVRGDVESLTEWRDELKKVVGGS